MFGIDNSPEAIERRRTAPEREAARREKYVREREQQMALAAKNAERARELADEANAKARAIAIDESERLILEGSTIGDFWLDNPKIAMHTLYRDMLKKIAPDIASVINDIAERRRARRELVEFLAKCAAIAQVEADRRDSCAT